MTTRERAAQIDPALQPDNGPLHQMHMKGPEPEPLPAGQEAAEELEAG